MFMFVFMVILFLIIIVKILLDNDLIIKSKTTVGDISVSYKIINPNGNEIITLVNSYGSTKDGWNKKFIKYLSDKYKIIVYDIRGVGESTDNPEHTVEQYSEDLYLFLKKLKIKKSHILGFSFGGLISQKITYDHPEIVDKLILIGSNVSGYDIDENIRNILFDLSGTDEDIWERRYKILYTEEYQEIYGSHIPIFNRVVLENQKNAILNWHGVQIEDIKNETLLIVGDCDVITPPEIMQEMHKKIENSWLVQISEMGHDIIRPIPKKICNIIYSFLKQ